MGTCVCARDKDLSTFEGGLPVEGLTGCPNLFVITQYPFGYCYVGGITLILYPSGISFGGN